MDMTRPLDGGLKSGELVTRPTRAVQRTQKAATHPGQEPGATSLSETLAASQRLIEAGQGAVKSLDEAKLAEIKAFLADGSFTVDFDLLANRMTDDAFNDGIR